MSNAIRYDAMLLGALAAELGQALRGARVARAWFDRTARVLALELGHRRAPRTLSWNLHPTAGQVALRDGVAGQRGALLQVRPGAPLSAVRAEPDERLLRFEFDAGDAAAGVVRAVVVELIGNRWNALALAADQVIAAAMIQRSDGVRELRAGVRYVPPPPGGREGVDAPLSRARWAELLGAAAPGERRRALLATVAWSSPLNAGFILGDAVHPGAGAHVLAEAWERYVELRTAAPRPCLLRGTQPYVHPLEEPAEPHPTLLAAFAAAASGTTLPALGMDALREAVRARLHEREARLQSRLERLAREAANAHAEADRQRALGSLLLARLGEVPRGAGSVELEDFSGTRVQIALDAALTPQQNAQLLFDQARRRERAARRTPALRRRSEAELMWLHEARARLDAGTVSAAELQQWAERAERREQAPALPYREYRTSGGLEVRVGRNSRANDALTRHHAAPEDIWLHARDVGGAHVILRWGRRDENPPRADLHQAAVLAALHSRARTSGVVAVDWTRRKYVRKPRKAPPGLVVPERVSTLFVEPSPKLEERLRAEDELAD